MNRRRFLTAKEVQAMMQAAQHGPTGERDYCLILLAFRHGLRISELLDLHYRDLDLNEGRINVRRLKNGFSTVHPLRFDEREAIEPLDTATGRLEGSRQKRRSIYLAPRHPAFTTTGLSHYPRRRGRSRNRDAYASAYAASCLRL